MNTHLKLYNKKLYQLACYTVLSFSLIGCKTQSKDYPIVPVSFNDVQLTDTFWNSRIKTNTDVTIPIAFRHCETTGRIDNFKIAGGLIKGDKFMSESPFDDSDVFKIIEGAAYSLSAQEDPRLEAYVDSLITYIEAAQEPDGYLYTYRTIMGDDSHPWIGSKRWEKTHILSHELYNLGHLFEAGVAYYQATGKDKLLNVCYKAADLLCKDFGPNAFVSYPGHQEVEIGLVKLYRLSGQKKYLDLAKFFLDARGTVHTPDVYNQSHKRVVEQDEAVGHSVRAFYMYTGMADVAALTGDKEYIKASKVIWDDIAKTKLYITGGIGAAGGHEGFGAKYELPNVTAYCETCAGIANVFWNERLFLMEGDAKYIDVLERSLYNNVLSGVSVSGDRFFYPNPLESTYGTHRSAWFGCACCPSNISRFIPNVPGYIYAQKGDDIYVNLFMSSNSTFKVGEKELTLEQKSGMPWYGNTEIAIKSSDNVKCTLKLRIPGWAREEAAPDNDLYWFADKAKTSTVVKLNGEVVPMKLDKGYLSVSNKWKTGDVVSIEFPMDVRRVQCNDKVEANRGKYALQRGPIVYCIEGCDFDDPQILDILLPEDAKLSCARDTMLNGLVKIQSTAYKTKRDSKGEVEVSGEVPFTAIPYYAWAQRESVPMQVWIAYSKNAAKPKPAPTIANLSTIEASVMNKSIEAIRDQLLPAGSNDRNIPYFHWWPHSNQTEWIVYNFDKPYTISKSKIFWFSDGGGCKAPKTWRLYYKKNNKWEEVKCKNEYGVQLDIINTTNFEPVTTTAVKLEVDLPKDCASGMHEWIIE